jgi:hypothetical protein
MTMRALLRLALAAVLGVAAALLVACGGSGKGLIPAAQAGPLQSDFEAVAHAAESGDGSCAGTEAALGKTEKDFLALPATVDAGLRSRLKQGIDNLRSRALAMCAQPAPTVTTATTPTATTETTTTPTATTTTPTTPTPAPPPSEEGGGTAAPGEEGEGPGAGKGKGKGKGVGKDGGEGSEEPESGGASAGGASPGAGQ